MRTRTSIRMGAVNVWEPISGALQQLGVQAKISAGQLSERAMHRMKDIVTSPRFWFWPFI